MCTPSTVFVFDKNVFSIQNLQFLVLMIGMSMYGAINVTSKMLGPSKKTLEGIIQEYGTHKYLKTEPRLKRRKDFFEKFRPSQRALIRLIVHEEFKKCNERKKNPDSGEGLLFPSVKLILQVIKEKYSEELPDMNEYKVYNSMWRLGFRYKRHPDTKNVLLIGM